MWIQCELWSVSEIAHYSFLSYNTIGSVERFSKGLSDILMKVGEKPVIELKLLHEPSFFIARDASTSFPRSQIPWVLVKWYWKKWGGFPSATLTKKNPLLNVMASLNADTANTEVQLLLCPFEKIKSLLHEKTGCGHLKTILNYIPITIYHLFVAYFDK